MHLLRRCLPFLASAAILLAACGKSSSQGDSSSQEIQPFDHRFTVEVGEVPVHMRLAILPMEQQRGLMFVKSMPDDEGMLFLYERPKKMSFWMRNTYIPLDIGFFDEAGVLQEVHTMFPHVEDPVASYSPQIRYALEMNRGWYSENHVGIGSKIDLAALATAVKGRGFESKVYVRPEEP